MCWMTTALVLREHGDLPYSGIHAVRQYEIDDAEFAPEWRRRLGAMLGKAFEAFAPAARHDDRKGAAREPADVTP